MCPLLPSSMGPLSGVTLVQQCFKHILDYIAANKPVSESALSSFFARPMGRVVLVAD